MPWSNKQFKAIMANTPDPKKRALYASEQEASKGRGNIDKHMLANAVEAFRKR